MMAPIDPKKAPDKTPKDTKNIKTLSYLNDGELKGLLDEALNYRNPKDREGKSEIFNHLLIKAEEDERNARASRAGGSELVRYCNPSAKRTSRHRKKPSSVSENMMHGGSLDNLAKEELFEHCKRPMKKSVSARQREGGSLPCNVNASSTQTPNPEYQFLEEARRKKKELQENAKKSTDRLLELEHNCCLTSSVINKNNYGAQQEQQSAPIEVVHYPTMQQFQQQQKYTSRATFQVNNVDDPIQVSHLEQAIDRKTFLESKLNSQRSNLYLQSNINRTPVEEGKKVDENGNALQQNQVKSKKKKIVADKNVVVCKAENVEGHRSDIINDMDKLMEFIGITQDTHHHHQDTKNQKSVKSKQLNRHSSEESAGKSSKKQKPHSSASSATTKTGNNGSNTNINNNDDENRGNLKKSNSLGEISTGTNLEAFEFNKKTSTSLADDNVVMRNTRNSGGDLKPRERRSWGTMDGATCADYFDTVTATYHHASAENLESAEFRVVTKRKKSKKRRNSISGRTTKAPSTPTSGSSSKHGARQRAPSPDMRRKSACSVPHSEKSNDSSDADSVHSLPIDTRLNSKNLNMPISYADMARTSDQKQIKKDVEFNVKLPQSFINITNTTNSNISGAVLVNTTTSNNVVNQTQNNNNSSAPPVTKNNHNNNNNNTVNNINNNNIDSSNQMSPPDVHNVKSFPAIVTRQVAVQVSPVLETPKTAPTSNNSNRQCNKMVPVPVNRSAPVSSASHTIRKTPSSSGSSPPDLMLTMSTSPESVEFAAPLPADIPDVQTIEKLQRISCYPDCSGGANKIQQQQQPPKQDNNCVDCDISERTTNHVVDNRPPVVILSGLGNNKEVPGLVFGFDINEQLLSEDGAPTPARGVAAICDDFTARFVAPDVVYNAQNHEKIVSFIGTAWDEVILNMSTTGKVQYYTDLL